MVRVTVKMNSKGARAILRSEAVRKDLERRARAIADAAGGEPDFEAESQIGDTRARASVRTATREGREAESRDKRLTRSIDAGRQ